MDKGFDGAKLQEKSSRSALLVFRTSCSKIFLCRVKNNLYVVRDVCWIKTPKNSGFDGSRHQDTGGCMEDEGQELVINRQGCKGCRCWILLSTP